MSDDVQTKNYTSQTKQKYGLQLIYWQYWKTSTKLSSDILNNIHIKELYEQETAWKFNLSFLVSLQALSNLHISSILYCFNNLKFQSVLNFLVVICGQKINWVKVI